jgi:hypothetical protein
MCQVLLKSSVSSSFYSRFYLSSKGLDTSDAPPDVSTSVTKNVLRDHHVDTPVRQRDGFVCVKLPTRCRLRRL